MSTIFTITYSHKGKTFTLSSPLYKKVERRQEMQALVEDMEHLLTTQEVQEEALAYTPSELYQLYKS